MGFIVLQRGGDLHIIPESTFPKEWTEEKLHDILEREPRFIAVEQEGGPRPTVVVASKLRLPSGDEADLLLLDSEGMFTLCELKRGDITRKTVGQILDYAAQLAEMPVEELWESIEQARQRLREQIQLSDEEWDEESLADERLSASLQRPRLVLVGWRIEDDALRIARWLQRHGVRMDCYAFSYFRWQDLEVFMPRNLMPVETGEEESGPQGVQPGADHRRIFWADMLQRLGDRIPHRRNPTPEWDFNFNTGIRGLQVSWRIGRSQLRVRLIASKKEHGARAGKLQEFVRDIEQETGEPWKLRETRIHFYIEAVRDTGGSAWEAPEEVRNWAVETLVRLYELATRRFREWMAAEE